MLKCVDTGASGRQFMRTTLDIDDDVLAAAKELSRQQGRPAGAVISTLLRQALTGGAGQPADRAVLQKTARGSVGGFRPFPSRGKPVTNAAIHALRDAEGV
jgi:Arc/MetJ family transcription regulator